jgi:hypothetical protein
MQLSFRFYLRDVIPRRQARGTCCSLAQPWLQAKKLTASGSERQQVKSSA